MYATNPEKRWIKRKFYVWWAVWAFIHFTTDTTASFNKFTIENVLGLRCGFKKIV
jgi:hypothetical protein